MANASCESGLTAHWDSGESYQAFIGKWSRLLAPKFLGWARVPNNARVLDVGCGTGALTEAVLATGARQVMAVDPSTAFIAYASSRLVDQSHAAEFRVGDAMDLPLPDGTYDAVLSELVLNFIPDPTRALREMHRVAKQNGIVSACVWDYADGMKMLRFFWDSAAALDSAARYLDEGVRFPLCHPEPLKKLFEDAKLSDVEVGSIEIKTRFHDFEDYWSPFMGGQGPAGEYLVSLDDGNRARLREKLVAELPTGPQGGIQLGAKAWTVRGLKPQR